MEDKSIVYSSPIITNYPSLCLNKCCGLFHQGSGLVEYANPTVDSTPAYLLLLTPGWICLSQEAMLDLAI